jgi:hypothetical protein
MLKLHIPPALTQEFATVEALWQSGAETRRVDSLLLSWVKYEKQLRRLFCFLVYQHPSVTAFTINAMITTMAQKNNLYPHAFIKGIKALGVTPVPNLVGTNYAALAADIARIKGYRNKLMHGQATGLSVQSAQLERDVRSLVEWVAALALGANTAFGYDGLRRKTFREAKAAANIAVTNFPFTSNASFGTWLQTL